MKEGRFADEIVAVRCPQRKGDPIVVETDEGVRPGTTTESLGGLRPAFDADGTITAGNASQISDGGARGHRHVEGRSRAARRSPLGEVVGYGQVAGPDASLLTQPSRAIDQALGQGGQEGARRRPVRDQRGVRRRRVASMDDLGITADNVNVNGGAIALGHPIGMSGARLALTSWS